MKRMKRMKRILEGLFMIGMIAVMAGVLIVPAMAALEGASTGVFSLKNTAPELTGDGVVLYESDESTGAIQMMPQTEYAVKISVADANTLNDIDTIVIVVQEAVYSGPDKDTDQATYQWSSTGAWSMTGPSGSTWSINGAECDVPTLTGTSGDWCLHFTPGKVARESVSNWKITATVTDKGSLSDNDPELTGLKMLWYGEIEAVDESFGFGIVDLGESDQPITDPTDKKTDVSAIANGNYKLESKSANWVGQGAGAETATLTWDGTLDSGEFQLENNAADSGTGNFVSDHYTHNTVPITGYADVAAPTAETGNNNPVYVWLSLATTGFIPQEYTGTFYLQIATV